MQNNPWELEPGLSPGTKESEDSKEVIVKEVAEADHNIEGNGLQQAHHLNVLPNQTQDSQCSVGYDWRL